MKRVLKTGIKGIGQWGKAKTHCPKGHEYTKENTHIEKLGNGKFCRRCKECRRQRVRIYYEKSKDKFSLYHMEYNKNNPEKIKLYDHRSTIKKYGLTLDEYNTILKNQNNGCAICGNKCSSGNNLSVDHCHFSGKIRGLLCGKCNKALGLFKDDSELLIKASEYLKKYKL